MTKLSDLNIVILVGNPAFIHRSLEAFSNEKRNELESVFMMNGVLTKWGNLAVSYLGNKLTLTMLKENFDENSFFEKVRYFIDKIATDIIAVGVNPVFLHHPKDKNVSTQLNKLFAAEFGEFKLKTADYRLNIEDSSDSSFRLEISSSEVLKNMTLANQLTSVDKVASVDNFVLFKFNHHINYTDGFRLENWDFYRKKFSSIMNCIIKREQP